MLLLLTLAFLAGTTCRAQEIWGNNAGTYFSIHGEEQGEIKAIKIYLTILKHIMGIQLQFGKHWSSVYGSPSANHKELRLEDGEHIIKVRGKVGLCLNSLTFITNKGNQVLFGDNNGRSFEDSGGPDKHLVTVNGMLSKGLCIVGIGFDWRHASKNGVSTKPQTKPVTIPNTSKEKTESKDKDKNNGDGGNDKDDNDDDDDDDDSNIRKNKNSNDDDDEEEEEEEDSNIRKNKNSNDDDDDDEDDEEEDE